MAEVLGTNHGEAMKCGDCPYYWIHEYRNGDIDAGYDPPNSECPYKEGK